MLLDHGSKLVMIGDSITDCGRDRPVGESSFGGLGNGYVSFVDAWLRAVYPEAQFRVANTGISGNTVRDLKARWQTDVLTLKPDYLTVMIGINDVWRHFDNPNRHEIHVSAEEYYDTLLELTRRAKSSVKQVFLLTPFFLELNRADKMRQMTDDYARLMAKVATETGAVLIDVQTAFDNALSHLYTSAWSGDRVHPNAAGHMLIAREVLNAFQFDWSK